MTEHDPSRHAESFSSHDSYVGASGNTTRTTRRKADELDPGVGGGNDNK